MTKRAVYEMVEVAKNILKMEPDEVKEAYPEYSWNQTEAVRTKMALDYLDEMQEVLKMPEEMAMLYIKRG